MWCWSWAAAAAGGGRSGTRGCGFWTIRARPWAYWTLAGDGFAAAQLGKYRAGSQSALSVVDSGGMLTGTLSLDDQVLSLDAAGRYFAVLTADRLDIYTKDLELYSTLEHTQGAQKVLLRSDGTAQLYVPS